MLWLNYKCSAPGPSHSCALSVKAPTVDMMESEYGGMRSLEHWDIEMNDHWVINHIKPMMETTYWSNAVHSIVKMLLQWCYSLFILISSQHKFEGFASTPSPHPFSPLSLSFSPCYIIHLRWGCSDWWQQIQQIGEMIESWTRAENENICLQCSGPWGI